MRVLITGGAGFIGRHLGAAFAADGHRVVALDDLSQALPAPLPDGVSLVEGDVRDDALVRRLVRDADLVHHLAAVVGPERVARHPVETWSRNVLGTATVLDACAESNTRVLIASSSEVHADAPPDTPLQEDDAVTVSAAGRRDVYAISKLAGEAHALALHREHLLPVTVLRPFNVVGAGQSPRYGMVLARFAQAACRGEPLPIYGDGTQRRCFLHVDDFVDAVRALGPATASHGRIVNVGNPTSTSIAALAEQVLALAGRDVGLRHIPFERVHGPGFVDPPCRVPDISRLQALVDWRPRRRLEDAVAAALADAQVAAG